LGNVLKKKKNLILFFLEYQECHYSSARPRPRWYVRLLILF